MARNLLFLYCALVGEEFSHLVQIWYSVSLTSSCLDYLKKILTTLIYYKREVLNSLKDVIDVSNSNWESCKDIWGGWLKIANNPEACQEVIDLRTKTLNFQNAMAVRNEIRFDFFPDVHKESLQVFCGKGLFLPLNSSEREEATHGNPTLTCFNPMKPEYKEKYPDINAVTFVGSDKDIFPLESDMIYSLGNNFFCAFICWDYLEVKKNVEFNNDVTEMYVSYLEKLFVKFVSYVKDRNIHFRLIVDDFQKLNEYLSPEEKYDRIGTNNLCDYYPTPSLLEQLGPRLNDSNEYSVLICREECWYHESWVKIMMLPFNEITALEDIKERPEILEGLPDTKRQDLTLFNHDYKDVNFFLFYKILKEILTYQYGNKNLQPDKTSVQSPLQVKNKMVMKFRDFRLQLNHVIPFHREAKVRGVNFYSANFYSRYIEWYPVRKN